MKSEFFQHGNFSKARVKRALVDFRTLNNDVSKLTTTELYGAYRAELAGKRRTSMLSRIEKRLRTLTAQRVSSHLHQLQGQSKPQKRTAS